MSNDEYENRLARAKSLMWWVWIVAAILVVVVLVIVLAQV